MADLINIDNAPSLMEEKARRLNEWRKGESLVALSKSKEEIPAEIQLVSRELKDISKELKEVREILAVKEKEFFLLASYKYALEKRLIEPTIINSKSLAALEREKRALLFEKMMTLTPEQLDKVKEIKL